MYHDHYFKSHIYPLGWTCPQCQIRDRGEISLHPRLSNPVPPQRFGSSICCFLTPYSVDQPQYTLSVLINKTPEEVTLTCGCFGFSSFYMLQQEIITKLVEMGSIPSNHHFMILYHKGTEYVPLLQVQYLDISSKLRLVYQGQGQGSVLIHFDDTYRRDLALGQYERREVIGSGSYGIVWRGRDTKKKAVVAIKEQITNNYKSQLTWAKELQAHQDVSGAPRVPKLIAHQSVSVCPVTTLLLNLIRDPIRF